MKREQPKPIEGNQQTEEIILTKGTKGETFFPWMKTQVVFFFTCSIVLLKRGCPVSFVKCWVQQTILCERTGRDVSLQLSQPES